MAMTTCRDCGKEHSRSAASCPQCGRPKSGIGLFGGLVAGFFIFVALIAITSSFSVLAKKQSDAQRLATLTPAQRVAEENEHHILAAKGACRQALMGSLNDPDSAQVEDSDTWFVKEESSGHFRIQPRARAKNAFGAYVKGVWNCSVQERAGMVRVTSLKQIEP